MENNYNKAYYYNKYKQIISNKRVFCECCQTEYASWNIYKHNKTNKHIINSMSEDEKMKYLEEKMKRKVLQKIEKLSANL
jgi:hypothetical protein